MAIKKKASLNGGEIDLTALTQAIMELESPKAKRERERAEWFRKIYPAIRDRIENNIAPSAIVKQLALHGVSLTPRMLLELVKEEAERRGEPVPAPKAKNVAPAALSMASAFGSSQAGKEAA